MPERFFECVHRLQRAVAGRSCAINLGGTILVITQSEFRAGDVLDCGNGVEGNRITVRVADKKLAHVLRVGAVIAFRLYIHLPGAAEAVEIIHEEPAHERLERLINLAEIDSLLDHFVPIDLHEDLRNVRQKCGD